MAEWWSGFFDEAYLEAWSADGAFDQSDQQARDLIALLTDLGIEPGARILDAPCGFGRFAGPLHAHGYEVVGIDASEVQVAEAEARHPGPAYAVGDMRTPPPGPFDAVLNLYSSFGYFDDPEDDRRCLAAWHERLRPGGLLVIETMHRDRLANLWDPTTTQASDRERGTTDWTTGVRTAEVVMPDGTTRQFTVRLYTATDLARLVREAGFTDVTIAGGLERAAFDPSTRLLLTAQKPD